MPQAVRFSGGKELARALNKLDVRMRRNIIRAAVREGADVIIEEAQVRAPVDTGELRNSLTRTVDNQASTKFSAAYRVGWTLFYGHFLEFGTSKMAAHPFVRPAFEAKHPEAENAMAAVVRLELRRRFGLTL